VTVEVPVKWDISSANASETRKILQKAQFQEDLAALS